MQNPTWRDETNIYSSKFDRVIIKIYTEEITKGSTLSYKPIRTSQRWYAGPTIIGVMNPTAPPIFPQNIKAETGSALSTAINMINSLMLDHIDNSHICTSHTSDLRCPCDTKMTLVSVYKQCDDIRMVFKMKDTKKFFESFPKYPLAHKGPSTNAVSSFSIGEPNVTIFGSD